MARYALLAGWCREHGCLHLLTAHHREDQVETHLIRCRAGSGPDGLAGISAIREIDDCRLLRPLLGVPKARLAAVLEAERQPFITDPSNSDPRFERSQLRQRGAVPVDADFTARQICTFGRERVIQDRKRNGVLASAVALHPAGFAVLDADVALAAPHEMAERVLAAIAATIGARTYPSRRERVARLRTWLAGARSRGHTLGGCRFVIWRKQILVFRELAAAAAPIRLTPGASRLWDDRFRVEMPAAAEKSVIIGYLGRAGTTELGRLVARPRRSGLPRLVYPILPTARDDDGIIAIPHLGYSRERVTAVPRFQFQPLHPLTRASFTVV